MFPMFGVPLALIWCFFFIYDIIKIHDIASTDIMFIAIIAIIAAVVGFLIGFTINRRAVRAADDILDQIRELKEGK